MINLYRCELDEKDEPQLSERGKKRLLAYIKPIQGNYCYIAMNGETSEIGTSRVNNFTEPNIMELLFIFACLDEEIRSGE